MLLPFQLTETLIYYLFKTSPFNNFKNLQKLHQKLQK